MNVTAVIPARGGSKGIHRKNLRLIMGMTLVQRSIQHALGCSAIDRVLVTSDDDEILTHAENCGAEPIKRPDDLATDTAHGDDVFVHALGAIGITPGKVPEGHVSVFLQPTSPIRPRGIIYDCIRELEHYDSAFTAYEGHFAWTMETKGPFKVDYERAQARPLPLWAQRRNRQEIPLEDRVFIENGAVYAVRTTELLVKRPYVFSPPGAEMPARCNRICGRVGIVLMDREDSIDIDNEYDLWLAEQRLRYIANERDEVAV